MIKIGLKKLNVRSSICAVMRIAILGKLLETVLSYFINVSAKRYV